MPRYNQRQPVDYANIYFGFIVWRAIFRVGGKILGAMMAIPLVITVMIFPDYSDEIITGYFAILLGIVALCIVWIIGVLIYRAIVPRTPKPRPEWVPQGAIANPPGDWLDSNGNRLWKRVGDHWERTTTLER